MHFCATVHVGHCCPSLSLSQSLAFLLAELVRQCFPLGNSIDICKDAVWRHLRAQLLLPNTTAELHSRLPACVCLYGSGRRIEFGAFDDCRHCRRSQSVSLPARAAKQIRRMDALQQQQAHLLGASNHCLLLTWS